MPSINTTPPPKRNPTRRGVLGALAAGSALAAAPSVFAAPTDTAIASAFRRWIALERHIEAIGRSANEDEFNAALDVADEIMVGIARMPAAAATDLAVKVYLLAHAEHGGSRANILDVALPKFGLEHVDGDLRHAIYRDAMNLLRPSFGLDLGINLQSNATVGGEA